MLLHNIALLTLNLGLGLCSRFQHTRDAPVVHTLNGSYYGIHDFVHNQDQFLGVPYAQPPVGALRFAHPQSLNESWPGLNNATEIGYSCVGYGLDSEYATFNYTSEDCLLLNIVRPASEVSDPLPVAVWIHGGGFVTGSGSTGWYNATFLVDRSVELQQPVILVNINYRLAGWGFMFSDELAQQGLTNLGLRDQRLALRWVQENIEAFGGDPSRVTIFGESAGSLSVGYQMLAFDGRDDNLFQRAIGQSGAPLGGGNAGTTRDSASVLTRNVTDTLCPGSANVVECLRTAEFEDLNNAINASFSVPTGRSAYQPVIDGDFIARSALEQLQDGAYAKVPYILGTNNDEGSYFEPYGISSDSELVDYLTSSFLIDDSVAETLLDIYPLRDNASVLQSLPDSMLNTTIGLEWKRAVTLVSDLFFKAQTRRTAQLWLDHNSPATPIYLYNANTTLVNTDQYLGASHGFELPYMFYNLNGSGWEGNMPPWLGGNPLAGRPQPYIDLAAVMSGFWIGFFNQGIPSYYDTSIPTWPQFNNSTNEVMVFDAQPASLNIRVAPEQRAERLDLVNALIYS